MTRRLALLAAPTPTGKVPTDEGDLNKFAMAYNDYVKSLGTGHIDLRAWRKVCKLWKEMVE